MKHFFFLCIFLYCLHIVSSQDFDLNFNSLSVKQFDKVEAFFSPFRNYSNPYDSDTIVSVDLLISSNSLLTLPCFYYIPIDWPDNEYGTHYDTSKLVYHYDQVSFTCRFTPTIPEEYILQVVVKDIEQKKVFYSKKYKLSVTESEDKGFINVNPNDIRTLSFTGNTGNNTFYPVGENLCWNEGSMVAYYTKYYLPKLVKSKANWFRYWLTSFARQEIESTSDHWAGFYKGVGVYSQESSSMLDKVLEDAERNDLYLQLCITQHGLWSLDVDSNWNINPYSLKNDGFLSTPAELFRSVKAIQLQKQRYRYLVARYSYSTHLFAWEHFNEVNLAGCYPRPCKEPIIYSEVAKWHDIMTSYVSEIDIHHHIITTSTTGEDELLQLIAKASTKMPQLQYHIYVDSFVDVYSYLNGKGMRELFPKHNLFLGEFGDKHYKYNETHPDHKGDHVRKTMWANFFNLIPANFWFWNTYVDYFDLYNTLFTPFYKFTSQIDPTSLISYNYTVSGYEKCLLFGLQKPKYYYGYIMDTSYGEWTDTPPTISNLKMNLPNLSSGTYLLTFFDPISGKISTGGYYDVDEKLAIILPNFTKEIAWSLTIMSK